MGFPPACFISTSGYIFGVVLLRELRLSSRTDSFLFFVSMRWRTFFSRSLVTLSLAARSSIRESTDTGVCSTTFLCQTLTGAGAHVFSAMPALLEHRQRKDVLESGRRHERGQKGGKEGRTNDE